MSKHDHLLRLFTIIGLLLMPAGWFIDHSDHVEWVQTVLAPRYGQAIRAYEHMLRTGAPLTPQDLGFPDIAEVLVVPGRHVAEISISNPHMVMWGSDIEMSLSPVVTVMVTLTNGATETNDAVPDVRPMLREKFLETPLFRSGAVVFWVGLFLSVLTIWLQSRDKRSNPPALPHPQDPVEIEEPPW